MAGMAPLGLMSPKGQRMALMVWLALFGIAFIVIGLLQLQNILQNPLYHFQPGAATGAWAETVATFGIGIVFFVIVIWIMKGKKEFLKTIPKNKSD
jgi:hypothetical protein